MPVSGSVMTSYGGKIECFPIHCLFSKSQDMKFVAKLCVLITGIACSLFSASRYLSCYGILVTVCFSNVNGSAVSITILLNYC